MPFEDGLGLDDHDGLPPCRQQSGAYEQSKPVGKPQTRTTTGSSEHADLVPESGIFDDEFSSGTQAEIGNDLERFGPVPKRGKVGPETADSTAEQRGDGSHGQFGPRSR